MGDLRKAYQQEPPPEERGVRIALPRRPRNRPAAVAFGLLALTFQGFSLIAIAVALLSEQPGVSAPIRIWNALPTLPFLLVGLGTLVAALTAWHHRCTIELTPDELRVVEHVQQLSWTRRRSARALRSIEVRERGEAQRARGRTRWQLEARFESGPPLTFAVGYAQAKLEEVAAHLREAALEWGEEVDARPPSPLREEESTSPAGPDVAADLPAGSEIQVHRTADGVVCVVPPMGVRRGSHGLFLMGLVFTTFVSVIGGFALLAEAGDGEWRNVLLGALTCATFFAVGAALMAYGWNLGRRSARLTVDEDGLLVERRGPFGDKVQRFAREAIEDVRAGPSGLSVNDVPVLELQVHVGGEKVLGLLSQRSSDECRAIAARLRDALRT